MKNIKWKSLLITTAVCLFPILLGIYLWESLPESIAIHFDIHGNPDNFASKGFTVFGFPLVMVALQWFSCILTDATQNNRKDKKFNATSKWTIPVISVVLQIAIFGYSLGWNIDMSKVASLIIGVVFVVTGIVISDYDKVKNMKMSAENARKVNRFMGRGLVILGILFLISIFLPSITIIACLILTILFSVISVIYSIIISKNKE